LEVTCIDMAMPMILIDAHQMDKTGGESHGELEADLAFMQPRKKSVSRLARPWVLAM
jgi:2-methylaconitate cis-trans-isomerase PrpF